MTARRDRDYAAEYRARVARARARGFASYRVARSAPSPATSVGGIETRRRALEAVSLMRREGLSLTAASRKASTTPATVRRHAGAALDQRGRTVAVKPVDRLRRRMKVLTPDGVIDLDLRSSRQASLAAEHWAAVRHFLATGDTAPLAAMRGVRVAGVDLETNPDRIEAWGRIGEIDLDDIYSITTK
jgi:hypothetical protein